eukprot:TRINITY_DN3581_c0_g1_i5.p1 TRINITY_DN3581_c0_g1~~TRINITY_DN3581_c0_g1_i5.p1  ORF type:complete len:760 (-),score=295.29 TRINITY_DN3581_c0_g1_i5:1606-3885(-)
MSADSVIGSDQLERIRLLIDSRREIEHGSLDNSEENRENGTEKWKKEAKSLLESLLNENDPLSLLQILSQSSNSAKISREPTSDKTEKTEESKENTEEKTENNEETAKNEEKSTENLQNSKENESETSDSTSAVKTEASLSVQSNSSSPAESPSSSPQLGGGSDNGTKKKKKKKEEGSESSSPSSPSSPNRSPSMGRSKRSSRNLDGKKEKTKRNPSFLTLPTPPKEEFDKQSLRDAAKDLANFESKEAPASPLVSAVRKGALDEPIVPVKQLQLTSAMKNIPKVMIKSASDTKESGSLSPITPRRTLVQLVEQMKSSPTRPLPLIFGQYFSSKHLIEWLEDYTVTESNFKDIMFNKEDAPLIAQQLYDLKFIRFVESISALSEKVVFQGKVISDPLLFLHFSLKENEKDKEGGSSPNPNVKESEFIIKVLRNPVQCMLIHLYLRQYHLSYVLTMWVETEILRTRGSRKPSMSSQEITARLTNIFAKYLSAKSATRLRLHDPAKTPAEHNFADVRMEQLSKAFLEKKVEKDREKVLYELQNDVAKYLFHVQLPKFSKSIFQTQNNELNEFHYYLLINKLRDNATGPLLRERKVKDITCANALTGYEVMEWINGFIYFENREASIQFVNQLIKNHSYFAMKIYSQAVSNGRLDLTNYWSSANSVGPSILCELESDFKIKDDSNFFYTFPLPIRPPSKRGPKEGKSTNLKKFNASLSRRKILQNMREYKTESFDGSTTPPVVPAELDPQKNSFSFFVFGCA